MATRELSSELGFDAFEAENAAAVRHSRPHRVLIGGFAVVMHGFVRATKDIDLLVEDSLGALRRTRE